MSWDAWACVGGIVLSFVVAKDICLHYCAFLFGNLAMQSAGLYDSTYLAIGFGLLGLADAMIGLYSGRIVLLCTATVSIMLAFEHQMGAAPGGTRAFIDLGRKRCVKVMGRTLLSR